MITFSIGTFTSTQQPKKCSSSTQNTSSLRKHGYFSAVHFSLPSPQDKYHALKNQPLSTSLVPSTPADYQLSYPYQDQPSELNSKLKSRGGNNGRIFCSLNRCRYWVAPLHPHLQGILTLARLVALGHRHPIPLDARHLTQYRDRHLDRSSIAQPLAARTDLLVRRGWRSDRCPLPLSMDHSSRQRLVAHHSTSTPYPGRYPNR